MNHLYRDLQERSRTLWSLNGVVEVEGSVSAPVGVAVLRAPSVDGLPCRLVDHMVLHGEARQFSFHVLPGDYRLLAYLDENGDAAYTPGERVEVFPSTLSLDGGGIRDDLEIVISRSNDDEGQLLMIQERLSDIGEPVLHAGEQLALSHSRFDRETGRLGVWEPLAFMRRYGAGIFLTEPHRAGRIPVLFVHGMSGYPQEFEALIESLDRERFEPWVAQYPSGWDLEESSNVFLRLLNESVVRHEVERLVIVAHSMGGVLVRRMLSLYAAGRPSDYVCGFVSIASPLGGHPGVSWGVAMLPVVVPSWHSLLPSGSLIETLYEQSLPSHVRYGLAVTFVGDDASDGVVPLSSQLRESAQDEAAAIRVLRERHGEVLLSTVLQRFVQTELTHCAEVGQSRSGVLEGELPR